MIDLVRATTHTYFCVPPAHLAFEAHHAASSFLILEA